MKKQQLVKHLNNNKPAAPSFSRQISFLLKIVSTDSYYFEFSCCVSFMFPADARFSPPLPASSAQTVEDDKQ